MSTTNIATGHDAHGAALPRDLDGELADSIVDAAMRRFVELAARRAELSEILGPPSAAVRDDMVWRAAHDAVLDAQMQHRLPALYTRADGKPATAVWLFTYARLAIRVDGMRRS